MKTYICQICGDAYLGKEKPKNCPFCGAREIYIKIGKEINPIVNQKIQLSDISIKNLKRTLELEIYANAIYLCMASKAGSYEIKAMYKRLAKVELEHAVICVKLLGVAMPKIITESCDNKDTKNFKKTIKLEDDASELYKSFAKEAPEKEIKILFTALAQVEYDHIELIKKYL